MLLRLLCLMHVLSFLYLLQNSSVHQQTSSTCRAMTKAWSVGVNQFLSFLIAMVCCLLYFSVPFDKISISILSWMCCFLTLAALLSIKVFSPTLISSFSLLDSVTLPKNASGFICDTKRSPGSILVCCLQGLFLDCVLEKRD